VQNRHLRRQAVVGLAQHEAARAVQHLGADGALAPHRQAMHQPALARGALEEDNYAQIDDPETLRLVDRTDLRSEPGFTAAFPANQGAEIVIGLRNGATVRQRLDNVIAATPEEIRVRFRQAAGGLIGDGCAKRLEQLVDDCASLADSRVIAGLCRLYSTGDAIGMTGSAERKWGGQ